MLRYNSAWMPVAGTAEDQMQSYSGESQLERRELAAGTRAGAWGRARIESGGRFSPHMTCLTAPRIVWAQPANRRLLFRNFERSLYLSPRVPSPSAPLALYSRLKLSAHPTWHMATSPFPALNRCGGWCWSARTHLGVCVRRV